MSTVKTQYTAQAVNEFLATIDNEVKRNDSLALIELMEQVSGEKAKMFGASIIGFGQYHYKYESGHEGDAPLIGFSPRKSAISLYVFTGLEEHEHLLQGLGKFKMGKACIYINKLKDIHQDVLINMMKQSISYLETKYSRIK